MARHSGFLQDAAAIPLSDPMLDLTQRQLGVPSVSLELAQGFLTFLVHASEGSSEIQVYQNLKQRSESRGLTVAT